MPLHNSILLKEKRGKLCSCHIQAKHSLTGGYSIYVYLYMLQCVCGEGTWGGGQEDGGDMRDRVWGGGGVCMGEGVSLRVYMGVGWGG